jgi:hypothetical protein
MVKGTDYVTAGQKEGTTLGTKATAEGNSTTASGLYSHAEGSSTTASGYFSHAEGNSTTAGSDNSHAEGYHTIASGYSSHAEGKGHCITLGKISGNANTTTYTATSVENIVVGQNLTYNGKTAKVTNVNRDSKTFTVNSTLSEEAVSEVYFIIDNKSSGSASHSEGEGCTSTSSSSHAEGGYTVASGVWSHTEGYGTTATRG